MPVNIARRPCLHDRKTMEHMSSDVIHDETKTILPKLPIPDLEETLEKYLLFVKPLVSQAKFEVTKKIVDEFGASGGIGEKIQQRLIEQTAKKENWAYEWWLNDMYLNNKASLPVNSNPGLVLPKQTFPDEASRLKYAAKLTSGILDFKVILDAKALPIDVARGQLAGQPLCMEQYYRLLNSYRLPGLDQDTLVSFKSPPVNEPEHIVVACNNQFFAVDVTTGNRRHFEADIFRQLEWILKEAYKTKCSAYPPVGSLTSLKRNEWAEARNMLLTDPTNRQSLDAMERCIFVLCLDKSTNAENDHEMARQMLHGCGPEFNSSNRWYDKTIQLMISRDGTTGLSYEHSASEGIAVIALIEYLLKYISIQEMKGLFRSTSVTEFSTPRRLLWNATDSINKYIERAQLKAGHTANTLDLEIFRFQDYGKDFIKRQNISPDAYVQVALQLTYYKLYRHLVSTYESASTRRFREGRVDNIRAATVQALDFARSVTEPDESGIVKMDAKKMLLLRRAIKAQTDFTIAAITGHGIDCHLLGLKMVAAEMGLDEPDIFSDTSYALCNYFQLSTSQIPTKTDSFMCYGAVVPDGYGVSYNPHDNSLLFCVSSFRTCPSTSSIKFVTALGESLRVMRNVCQLWNRRRSSSLELIDLPRKLTLHRRIKVGFGTNEERSLRENASVAAGSSEEEAQAKSSIKGKHFRRQKSLNTIRTCRSPFQGSTRPNIFQQGKLYRQCSDVAINKPLVQTSPTTPPPVIPNDLIELIKQESITP